MAKNLMIVESPTKAKTLKKFLGGQFEVIASQGHIVDLPKSKIGIDIENGFLPKYVVQTNKREVVKKIRKKAAAAEKVFISSDPDREGEAIAWHIAEQIRKEKKVPELVRAVFHEITPKAVREAVAHPRELNQELYDSQQARRVIDRLVGYEISPLLWKKVRQGLSAGRVQSVALRLLVEREEEIEKFVAREYWEIATDVRHAKGDFVAHVSKVDGKKADLPDAKTAEQVAGRLRDCGSPEIARVERKERKRRPVPPFITSTLQQDAARRHRFPAKRTMDVAQQLYQGVDIGEAGSIGLITYMRTDSVRVSEDALTAARGFIRERFGDEYLPTKAIHYRSRKTAQDAHEAIRPTYIEYPPEKVKPFVNEQQFKLYSLIWNRFIASQMEPARYDQTTIIIDADGVELRTTGSVMLFNGFLAVYQEAKGLDDKEEASQQLPAVETGDTISLEKIDPSQHFTQAPPRYTEASLIRLLEEEGIGRPSTYAAILSKIVDRKYVDRKERRLIPTHLGRSVTRLLVEAFPTVMETSFTADLERQLDGIAEGEAGYGEVLSKFYEHFSKALAEAQEKMPNLKVEGEKTDLVCPDCSSGLVIKTGRNGEFLACSAYPECKFTGDFERTEDGKVAFKAKTVHDEPCPKCGKELIERSGRYGTFFACTGYPECRFTRPKDDDVQAGGSAEPEIVGPCPDCKDGKLIVKKTRRRNRFISCSNYPECKHAEPFLIGVACPDCGGQLQEKAGAKKVFYGCTGYPECKHVSWNLPVNEACPDCGHAYLVEYTTKKEGAQLRCPNKECGYKRPLEKESKEKVEG